MAEQVLERKPEGRSVRNVEPTFTSIENDPAYAFFFRRLESLESRVTSLELHARQGQLTVDDSIVGQRLSFQPFQPSA